MRLEDMKKDIPETPEFIHTMIQSEVKKQLQDTKVVNIQTRRVKKWTGARVVAAIAVCVLATSTIVYAGTKLYHMFLEKQGAYSIVTGIKADGSTGKINLPERIHDIDISAGYIPEGMEWIDEFHLEYPEHDRTGGFSFASVLLDEDDLSKVMQDKNVVDCEERTFGNYEGVYLKYNDLAEDGSFNQRIYLLRPDVYRVITVYIGDDISKEDAIKVVENLVITENDTMIETAGLYTWSEMVSPEESSGEAVMTSIADNKLLMHQIGEVFDISASGEDRDGNYIENEKQIKQLEANINELNALAEKHNWDKETYRKQVEGMIERWEEQTFNERIGLGLEFGENIVNMLHKGRRKSKTRSRSTREGNTTTTDTYTESY